MLEEHAKIMAVLQSAGEITGRKKLQKMIFIAKKLNFPFHEKYDFHFFGPYSEELTLKMEELTNLGLVIEREKKGNGYVQYCYTLSEEGERFLTHYNVTTPELQRCVQMMNEESARFLELVSTMLFFEQFDKDKIVEKISVVKEKQHYSKREFDDGFQFIEALKECATRFHSDLNS